MEGRRHRVSLSPPLNWIKVTGAFSADIQSRDLPTRRHVTRPRYQKPRSLSFQLAERARRSRSSEDRDTFCSFISTLEGALISLSSCEFKGGAETLRPPPLKSLARLRPPEPPQPPPRPRPPAPQQQTVKPVETRRLKP
eukprot:461380-Rhodomonas_salina.1